MDRATIQLSIQPMHCGGCVTRVTNLLRALPAVVPKSVAIGSAEVDYDPIASTEEAVVAALRKAGYTVEKQG